MRKKFLISCSSFRSIHNFTPKSNHLLFEVCDSVGSSKLRWRGWLHAACVPSETPDTPKTGKRVPKHERRAMVECFVNKYRSENAGKFPAIKYTQKEVGGGYYVIREIIQELEYKSKMKSSNSMDGILVEKQFNQSKRKTAESVNVSSDNIETAKDRPIQDDSHLVLLDSEETANSGCEHLEEKRVPQTSSWEGRLSNEVDSTSTPLNHCFTSESNISEKHFKEPSSLQMSDDVKTEGAVSSYADSVSSESQLLHEETGSFSIPSSESHGHVYDKTGRHESEMIDMESHKNLEEICAEKESYERREQPALEDMSGEASHSSPQVPNDVKSMKADSSCPSDYVAPEEYLLKEEIEKVSAPLIEKSGSKDQTHDSKSLDRENHPTVGIRSFEKVQFERKVLQQDPPGVDSLKHKKEQSQVSLELDESKNGSSNKRETSSAVVPRKPTLWGNLKSLADGIINIWRKL